MKLFNAVCPKCAARNKDLYLEETSGIFECEKCHSVVKAKEYEKRKITIHETRNMRLAT